MEIYVTQPDINVKRFAFWNDILQTSAIERGGEGERARGGEGEKEIGREATVKNDSVLNHISLCGCEF